MTTQLDDDTLQRYYDGELSPVEERAVRARVEGDAVAQARLAELQKLSEMVRMAADEMGAGLDSSALFAGIQADVKKQAGEGVGARLRVVREEWGQHRRGSVVAMGVAGAIAAAALLSVLTPAMQREGSDEVARSVQQKERVRLAEAPAPASAPADGSRAVHAAVAGSQVENVDFGDSTGTVFEIESEGVKTAVVWISDEDEGTGP
jgi:anti-sigma factor RsiW